MKLQHFAVGGGLTGAAILILIGLAIKLAIVGTLIWAIWTLVTYLTGGGTTV